MSKRKRCVIFSDSDSEHEFDSKLIPPPRKHSRHSPNMAEDKVKKRSIKGHKVDSKSPSASEHSPSREKVKRHTNDADHHPRRKKKEEKHRSIFEEGDLDTEADAPRGKVQLTIDEIMRAAQEKKSKEVKAAKPVKTLEHFFSAMTSPSSSKAASKVVEVSVDDFFGSAASSSKPLIFVFLFSAVPKAPSTPTKTAPLTLVEETPIKEDEEEKAPVGKSSDKKRKHRHSSPTASPSM
ncbi:unnamed protein product, partial [Dibothriocephalus latus]